MLCICWDQVGVICYEQLKPNEAITAERYRLQLLRLSRTLREKRPQYEQRHEKVILQHDNAHHHVAKPTRKRSNGKSYPTRHIPRLSLVPFDSTWPG
ncbi:hypothetical protein Trydic_g14334 [Trypoxylus dichotomus]